MKLIIIRIISYLIFRVYYYLSVYWIWICDNQKSSGLDRAVKCANIGCYYAFIAKGKRLHGLGKECETKRFFKKYYNNLTTQWNT